MRLPPPPRICPRAPPSPPPRLGRAAPPLVPRLFLHFGVVGPWAPARGSPPPPPAPARRPPAAEGVASVARVAGGLGVDEDSHQAIATAHELPSSGTAPVIFKFLPAGFCAIVMLWESDVRRGNARFNFYFSTI